MKNNLFLKSFDDIHDESLMEVMVHMIESHQNAEILMASSNVINVGGKNLTDFLQTLVSLVPVRDMKVYKCKPHGEPKQIKHEIRYKGEVHSIHFTFYELEMRRLLKIPPTKEMKK